MFVTTCLYITFTDENKLHLGIKYVYSFFLGCLKFDQMMMMPVRGIKISLKCEVIKFRISALRKMGR